MLFVPVIRHSAFHPSLRAFDRFFSDTAPATETQANADTAAFELTFDVPGVSREQLSIGIEGNVIRIETLPEAKRQYKAAYELAQDIDVSKSEAKLENGVLTLKLAKVAPESKAVKLTIN
ncbi:Hsp20/alpha crystallin family protein [Curvibacter sp. CHRR-16]|uniref:Hsp20/alpha crystallin family protein n=1 Tax=Curvibacter sp. CHRR-16 TaxID=2835872 RepID=UPI001BD97839|nr:Hsp20/alpha crystallin family protein [Curvibacter sp. CHRR-16]MBT0571479.1 Hsp20/alpha crystallin family protein [Curvibacter sp. CHRR-16]